MMHARIQTLTELSCFFWQDVGEKELLGFIDLIRIEGRFPRFMNFLITQCGSAHRPVPRNQNIMAPGFFSDSEFVLVKGVKVVIDKSDKTDCEITWVDRSNGSVKSWRCGTIAGAYQDDLDTADITEWFRSEEFIEKNPNVPSLPHQFGLLHSAFCMHHDVEHLMRCSLTMSLPGCADHNVYLLHFPAQAVRGHVLWPEHNSPADSAGEWTGTRPRM